MGQVKCDMFGEANGGHFKSGTNLEKKRKKIKGLKFVDDIIWYEILKL